MERKFFENKSLNPTTDHEFTTYICQVPCLLSSLEEFIQHHFLVGYFCVQNSFLLDLSLSLGWKPQRFLCFVWNNEHLQID